MARPVTRSGMEIFRPGEKAPYSGEYCVVDQEGNQTDYDTVTLDEGEALPQLQDKNLCFSLCEVDEVE